MQPFIAAARQQLIDTMQKLSENSFISLRIGLVEYRDHPPQDQSFVTRVNQLTGDLDKMRKTINRLKADGGGDVPEAVYDGVFEACTRMEWSPFSSRFVLLVGDAPPHGVGYNPLESASSRDRRHSAAADGWPGGCPCGLTSGKVTAAAEDNRVTIHAVSMHDSAETKNSFSELARGTGGHAVLSTAADDVVNRIVEVLDSEFRDIDFDGRVLNVVRQLQRIDISATADAIGCSRLAAASSIARLGKRGFLRDLTIEAQNYERQDQAIARDSLGG
jgi:hypothetical protein